MKNIRISNKVIGTGSPCFIIAEAGVNHNGDVSLAKKMIEAAKKAGADAVKFQAYKTEHLVTKTAAKVPYQLKATGRGSQYSMLKKLELSERDIEKLADHAKKKEIIFLASPFDRESVDLLHRLKVPAFKIASGEITNFPLLRHIAKKKKPVIMSTGMSTLVEVKAAVRLLAKEGVRDIALLHCVSDYPARVEELNLRAMDRLKRTFRLPVGFSDHSLGITVPIAAAALGANIIEKHFTLNKTLPGPDHKASLELGELSVMIAAVRAVEKAMGSGVKAPTRSEQKIKKLMRRYIVARTFIARGTTITEGMLAFKRARAGLEPRDLNKVLGKKARKDIGRDEPITSGKVV